jgi:23S rRNA pseudouridine1911/1915/1917 synthase
MMPTLKVSSDQEGKRLDVVLARAYPDYSRVFLQKWIREGRVTSAGHELIPNHRLQVGETIEVAEFRSVSPSARHPVSRSCRLGMDRRMGERADGGTFTPQILFEDDSILVLNKPAGLVVHPAASHKGPTLVDWLAEYLGPKLTGLFSDASRLGVVHRLDKDTTGVLLVAKTALAQNLISKQFQDRRIQKTYAAFVEGIPEAGSGIISAPVGRSHKVPSRMAVSSAGRPSETTFEVVKTFKEVSQVSLHPKTGRTHQIRVHCAAIGHPIVGDCTYGSSPRWPHDYGINRPLLHAERLEIQHPLTRKKAVFEAPWPADMKQALVLFRSTFKMALLALCLAGIVTPAQADETSPAPKTTASHTAQPRSGGQISSSVKTLKRDMASLHTQFKALIEEVSALQDRVTAIQSSLDQLDASRRLRDLEKALSDLNGKTTAVSNVAEEAKSQALDLSRKLKAQQDALDTLRDQVDRLQQELNEIKAHQEAPAPPVPANKP